MYVHKHLFHLFGFTCIEDTRATFINIKDKKFFTNLAKSRCRSFITWTQWAWYRLWASTNACKCRKCDDCVVLMFSSSNFVISACRSKSDWATRNSRSACENVIRSKIVVLGVPKISLNLSAKHWTTFVDYSCVIPGLVQLLVTLHLSVLSRH